MNILVADDEYYARKALVHMITDWNAHTRILEAEDGREALKILASECIDLLFVDIRMPNLDGLDLAAHLYESRSSTAVVIVSGYDDFSYAQRAIQYKVEHYLLKPADRDSIHQLLDQIHLRVQSDSSKQLASDLAAAVYGDEEVPPHHWIHSIDTLVTSVIQSFPPVPEPLKEAVRSVLSETGAEFQLFFDKLQSDLLIICLYRTRPSGRLTDSDVKTWLSKILHESIKRSNSHISIGVSSIYKKAAALPDSYKEAKTALLNRFLAGENRVFYASEALGSNAYDSSLIDEWIRALHQWMVRNQTAKAEKAIRSIFAAICQMPLSVFVLQDFCAKGISMCNSILEWANARGGPPHRYFDQIDLHRFNSLSDVADAFIQAVRAVCHTLQSSSAYVDKIEDVKRYVEQNYAYDLSLENIARTIYHTDPSYFSRLFKKKTGMRFSEYVLAVRMKQARILLEAGILPTITEVATSVGFNDTSYFIQMYKRYFGETPGKSKNQKGFQK